MNFIHSIKFRFTLWYLLVLAVTLLLLCSGVYLAAYQILFGSLDQSLERNLMEAIHDPNVYTSARQDSIKQPTRDLLLLAYYSGDELVKEPARNRDTLDDRVIRQVMESKRAYFTYSTDKGEDLRCFGTWLPPETVKEIQRDPPHNPENMQAVLIMGRPIGPIQQSLDTLLSIFVAAVPLCLLVAGAGGVFLAGRILKPVDTMTRTAREIEENDLSRRIDLDSGDELGRLALTLNQMIGRLEQAFNRQRQFTGDASHELRAPLAIIQAESSLALRKERSPNEYRQSLETISQEAGHMAAIINQLLTLARSDSGKEASTFSPVDLASLLQSVAADAGVLCVEKGLFLVLDTGEPVAVSGDAVRLRRLFLNMLDNAVRYTPAGGTLSVKLSANGQYALVTISDTGIGIPREHLGRIFDRFYRVDKARSRADGGSGLGLAICRDIAGAHGGSISVESEAGKGSQFTIKLPLMSK